MDDLRTKEIELLEEFYQGCKRLLELDGELMTLHSQLVAVGQQGSEPYNRRDVLGAAGDLVTREEGRRRRVAGTTKTQPNPRTRRNRVYGLKK